MKKEISINRTLYDDADEHISRFVAKPGINEEVVRMISKTKNEPEWMLEKRLKGLKLFLETSTPNWGPDLSSLDFNNIIYFSDPNTKETKMWEDVPPEIKRTFDRLGIPEAEKKALAGVGAQYDSSIIYHNIQKSLEEKGVIFENMDVAVQKYPELVKKYFMTTCIPIHDHKFIMLHTAVWSGGTFIYIPKNVKVDLPLQAYFRMNAQKGGQFEHTLIIVDEGAELHYIEGCFTGGNLITTNTDYKPIEKIEVGTKVLADNGTYKRVKEIYKRSYTGIINKITLFGNPIYPIKVTEDHPFLYVDKEKAKERNQNWSLRWNIPKYFKKGDYLASPINKTVIKNKTYTIQIKKWNNKKKNFDIIDKEIPSTKEFFRLVGYYLAEGSISNGYYLNFSFGIHEKELVKDVKRLLKKVFCIEKIYDPIHKKNNGISVVVSSVGLCRIFEQFGKGAPNKQIPQGIMLEDPEKQKELIKGWYKGDGNYYNQRVKNNSLKELFRINSTSHKLVLQGKDILHRLGIAAFINKRNRTKEGRKDMYTLGISGDHMIKFGELLNIKIKKQLGRNKRGGRIGINKDFVFYPIRHIKSEEVKNMSVYNFAVEDRETYCVNGLVAHNCSSPSYSENSLHAGCVELHVLPGAHMRYSSIENWSKNVFNLNTKRALVHKDATVIWTNGNMGCLTGDSEVFTNPKGPVKIKEINEGDKVFVWDKESNSIKRSIVKAKMFSGIKKVYKMKAGGREIEATANHLFLTLTRKKIQGWKALEKLKVGDKIAIVKNISIQDLTNEEIGYAKIDKISSLGEKPTYDIEVEGYHNFIANGLIVHNSSRTMLYPSSVLIGEGARSESIGIAFAGHGQNQDTGAKAIHVASNTTSIIKAKSISKSGGISSYRGLVQVLENAKNVKATVKCDALILDEESSSKTYPFMKISNNTADITHEATVGKIGEEKIFYLMSRGLDEEQAIQMIVNGFIEPIVKALPLEYAVELNKLIELEIEEL